MRPPDRNATGMGESLNPLMAKEFRSLERVRRLPARNQSAAHAARSNQVWWRANSGWCARWGNKSIGAAMIERSYEAGYRDGWASVAGDGAAARQSDAAAARRARPQIDVPARLRIRPRRRARAVQAGQLTQNQGAPPQRPSPVAQRGRWRRRGRAWLAPFPAAGRYTGSYKSQSTVFGAGNQGRAFLLSLTPPSRSGAIPGAWQ